MGVHSQTFYPSHLLHAFTVVFVAPIEASLLSVRVEDIVETLLAALALAVPLFPHKVGAVTWVNAVAMAIVASIKPSFLGIIVKDKVQATPLAISTACTGTSPWEDTLANVVTTHTVPFVATSKASVLGIPVELHVTMTTLLLALPFVPCAVYAITWVCRGTSAGRGRRGLIHTLAMLSVAANESSVLGVIVEVE